MMTPASFKELFSRLWVWKREYTEVQIGNFSKETATQSDKPSPHSSLTLPYVLSKLRKEWPSSKGYLIARVSNTNSMEPYIDQNTLCVLEKIDYAKKLYEGDICVYDRQGTMIVHRITSIDYGKNKAYFKGDNNYLGDGWVPFCNIKHRVVGWMYTEPLQDGD